MFSLHTVTEMLPPILSMPYEESLSAFDLMLGNSLFRWGFVESCQLNKFESHLLNNYHQFGTCCVGEFPQEDVFTPVRKRILLLARNYYQDGLWIWGGHFVK